MCIYFDSDLGTIYAIFVFFSWLYTATESTTDIHIKFIKGQNLPKSQRRGYKFNGPTVQFPRLTKAK